jgi:hypothetical protein
MKLNAHHRVQNNPPVDPFLNQFSSFHYLDSFPVLFIVIISSHQTNMDIFSAMRISDIINYLIHLLCALQRRLVNQVCNTLSSVLVTVRPIFSSKYD